MEFPVSDDFNLTLANGQEIEVLGFEGQVMWHGRRREVLVLETAGTPLMGMNLLWRNRITIDAHANGQVVVEELE